MKINALVTLVIALAIVTVIILTTSNRPQSQAFNSAGQPLLPGTITQKATQIEVTEKDSAVPITLQKSDNGLWRIISYYNAPANLTRIAKLTDDLEASKIQRSVTSNPERFERLGLGQRTVTFRDAQQNEIYKILIGESSPEAGFYVKMAEDDTALEAHPQVFFTANPDEWMARDMFQFKLEDITALSIELLDGGEALFRRDEQGTWQLLQPQIPEGRSLKADMPESLLRQLLGTSFFQHQLITDETSQAALASARRIDFTLSDGETISLRVGRAPANQPEGAATPPGSSPVLIFLQSAPEAYVWSEAARTIIPYGTETLLNMIPGSLDAMLAAPSPQDVAAEQPLIPPAPAE